jgi:hypothetical protein
MCHIKSTTTGQYEQVMMMMDEHFVILLKPDQRLIRAQVILKVRHKQVAESLIDRKDPRVVVMAILDPTQPNGYVERRITFEDWRKAIEVKDHHMDQTKVQQLQTEKTAIEEFLKECDLESNEISSK